MIAYDKTWLRNLHLAKESREWWKQGILSKDQFSAIEDAYPSHLYHPNFIIRILLFLATVIAALGCIGLVFLTIGDIIDDSPQVYFIACGVITVGIMDFFFIQTKHHFKSGVNEALLYLGAGFIIGGFSSFWDFSERSLLLISLLVSSFAVIRYADLIATACTMGCLAGVLFIELYKFGGIATEIMPSAFIFLFGTGFVLIRIVKPLRHLAAWENCMILAESICLLLVYAAGNYFVAREFSVSMLDQDLEEGEDIPFAIVFYALTVLIPLAYLYFGIKRKDIILLRISLVVLAFSAFTFKYYFSLGHPEISLTSAGAVLIGIALALFRLLRTSKSGFTRERLLTEKWAAANPEAFIISQTMGGNNVSTQDSPEIGGGGQSSGGGAADTW